MIRGLWASVLADPAFLFGIGLELGAIVGIAALSTALTWGRRQRQTQGTNHRS